MCIKMKVFKIFTAVFAFGALLLYSVDTGAPKTISSTQIISFHCEFSTTLVPGEKVLHRQSLFCKDHGYDEKEAFL